MSDIFLSYAIEDRQKAANLAEVFKNQHWTVWWGYITRTEDPVAAIGEALTDAKLVVVLWSRSAEESSAVRYAIEHTSQHSIVFVLLEKVELPTESESAVFFDFSDWNGESSHEGLQLLLLHIRALIAVSSLRAAPRASLGDPPRSKFRYYPRTPQKERADSSPEADVRFKGVFISYRRSEAAAYARGLYDRLATRFGKENVFLDVENVGWGEDFVEAITAAAEGCAVMIVLVSRQWARGPGVSTGADDYVRLEVATALGRGIRVVPILIQGAAMPAAKELSEDLAPLLRRNALALSDTRWERDVEDLIRSLEGLLKD
jgi:hypothetical protein